MFDLRPQCLPLVFLLLALPLSQAKDLRTNEVWMSGAPTWLKRVRIEKITDKIQRKLEWSTRRVEVKWHPSSESFQMAHTLGPIPGAVTVSSAKNQTIHMGPKVQDRNFDQIFAHELIHIIIFQKYRGAIPKWLEEGLANHLSKSQKVDYNWLSQQELPLDVSQVAHPYKGSPQSVTVQYKVSQALIEMLESKCNLENLIRLSVQRKMEDYIKTYCELPDLNKSFKTWLQDKTKHKNTQTDKSNIMPSSPMHAPAARYDR